MNDKELRELEESFYASLTDEQKREHDEFKKLLRGCDMPDYRKAYHVPCPVNVGTEPKCFNRNLKPLIKIRHYDNGLSFWVVERDMSVPWKHLTMQEKENINAAYDYLRFRMPLPFDLNHVQEMK